MRAGLFDSIMALAICGIILAAVAIFIGQSRVVNNVVSSEAKELKLIRAIYIDEFARKYVSYGIDYILNDTLYPIFDNGGLPVAGTLSGDRYWINITPTGNITSPEAPLMKNETIPMDANETLVYYQWCTDMTTQDCTPAYFDRLVPESRYVAAISNKIESSAPSSPYIGLFKVYADMPMLIDLDECAVTISSSDVSLYGRVHVLVTLSNGGVNSTQYVYAYNPLPLLRMNQIAKSIAHDEAVNQNLISQALGSLDCSKTDEAQLGQDFDNYLIGEEGGDIGGYDWETNTTILIEDECLYSNTLHTLGGDFRFRTEARNCTMCP